MERPIVGIQHCSVWQGLETPGGRLQCEMPGCVCWGSKNAPIMKDALCQKNTHIEGILSTLIPILWCNIKLNCIIHKGY